MYLDLPPLIPEVPLYLPADARHRVGGQDLADVRVEVVDGLHQAHVADLHQVVGGLGAVEIAPHA